MRFRMDFSQFYHSAVNLHSAIPCAFRTGWAFPPLLVLIETTYLCNVRCSFCQLYQFVDDDSDLAKLQRNILTKREIIGIAAQTPPFGIVTFTGGEPFIRKDFMEILRESSRMRRTHVITNGTLMDEEKIREMVRLGCRSQFSFGLFLVGFSVHGPKEIHDGLVRRVGAFDKAIQSIETLIAERNRQGKRQPFVNFKLVITQDNVGYIADQYRLARELGTDYFNIMIRQNNPEHRERLEGHGAADGDERPAPPPPVDSELLRSQLTEVMRMAESGKPIARVTPSGMPIDEIVAYYNNGEGFDLRSYDCPSLWSKAYVSAYGDVLSCPFNRLGNIREAPLSALWNNRRSREFRRRFLKKGTFPGCFGCCNLEYHGDSDKWR